MIARLLDRLSGRREAALRADVERLRVALASLLSGVDTLGESMAASATGRPGKAALGQLAWSAGRAREALARPVTS